MKARLYRPIVKRTYALKKQRWYYGNSIYEEIEIEDGADEIGKVGYDDEEKGMELIYQSNGFSREFDIGEKIEIDNLESQINSKYTIIDKTHSNDGCVNYYIDDMKIVDDEESRIEAEKKMVLRMEYIIKKQRDRIDDLEDELRKIKESEMIKEIDQRNQKLRKRMFS